MMTGGPERSDFSNNKDFVDALLAWIVKCGTDWYYDEGITQLEHAVQSAVLARSKSGNSADITAALLHDVGHFLMQSQAKDKRFHDRDLKHEIVGANWLARAFCPQVTEPVRLHVPAKRYLCAVDPGYWAGLSDGSKTSLVKQGGPMSEAKAKEFSALPGCDAAVRLRQIDDQAKVAGLAIGPIEDFADHLVKTLHT
jgi:phosphonate degradation associated HDIG domain protein